jgi:hypothetical protein
MTSDVGAVLAMAATGVGTKVVDITLRLKADPGNSAVVKQLSDQIGSGTRKAVQEVEDLGQKLVGKANDWATKIRASMSKALEQSASGPAPPSKGATKLAEAPAGKASAPAPPASGAVRETAEAKTPDPPGAKEHIEAATHLISLMQRISGATGANNEATKQGQGKLEQAKSALEGLGDLVAVVTYLKALKGSASATATGADAVGAAGLGSKALNLGKGALARLGGGEGLAVTAEVAAAGALIVSAGVLVHDGLKTILNLVKGLGGQFDTLTGTLIGWNESIKNSAEIEKQIAIAQSARKELLEQRQVNQETTRSYYEARERIDDAKKFQKEVPSMALVAKHYRSRFDADSVTTERDLQVQGQRYTREDRQLDTTNYASKFNEKREEQEKAAKVADATRRRNQDLQRHPPMQLIMPALEEGKDGDEGIPEGAGWYFRKLIGPTVEPLTREELRHIPVGQTTIGMAPFAQHQLDQALGPSQPILQPAKINLQDQLSQQEKALTLANELRDTARERSNELQSQLRTMDQQVRAAQQQVAAVREQLEVAKERELSEKARMSMMSKGEQKTATDILKRLAQHQNIDRGQALFLQQHGLVTGSLGHKINDRLAEDLDPEFVKWRKAAGGEESLEDAQNKLAQSMADLADAQKDANKVLADFTVVFGQYKNAGRTALDARLAVEQTKAARDGGRDPTQPSDGEKAQAETIVAAAKVNHRIDAARNDFVAAIHEIGKTAVAAIKAGTAEARATAQRIKQAQ